MPRATEAPETRVLTFFKTAPITIALVILGLAKDVVKERQHKPQVRRVAAVPTVVHQVHAAKPKPAAKAKGKTKVRPKAKHKPLTEGDTVDTQVEDLD